MVVPRLRAAVLLTLGACVLAACADRAAGAGDTPSEDVDARAWCPELDAGPLAALASSPTAVSPGPCGHLIYAADDQAWLYTPGGGPEAIDAQSWSAEFSPTGHLAAWEHASVEGLALRDLLTGEQLELDRAQTFGFVPAPDAEHGADLWACADETLTLAGPVDSAIVAGEVRCDSVRGSTGSPRVVFADVDGGVRFADLETLDVWSLDDLDYADGVDARDDWLWIDHDGVVVVHHLSHWVSEPDSDADWQEILGARVFAAGERLASFAEDAPYNSAQQAPTRGAPALLRPSGRITAIADGARHDHSGDFSALRLDRSGRGLTIDEDAGELLRVGRDGDLELLADGLAPADLVVATGGEWVALELDGGGCLEDAMGECDWLLGELALWREGEGVITTGRSGLRWELLGVNDAGQVLALGTPLEPGATPDPLPDPELILLDAQLQELGSWPAPAGFVRTVVGLDDGRFVVELHETGVGGSGLVLLADPAQGVAPVELGAGVDHNRVWVDATQTKLAFAAEGDDGDMVLFAGEMPG